MKIVRVGILLTTVFAVTTSLFLTGCSDYPSSGRVDTHVLRSQVAIIDVKGNVYGLKVGGREAFLIHHHDSIELGTHFERAWKSRMRQEEIPPLNLAYEKDVTGFGFDEYQESVKNIISDSESEVDKQMAQALAESRAKIDKYEHKLLQVESSESAIKDYISSSKTELEEANETLNYQIQNYESALSSSLSEVNKVSEIHGLSPIDDAANPLRNYIYTKYENDETPAICPDRPGFIAVNLLKEESVCGYYHLTSNYVELAEDLATTMKESMVEILRIQQIIGQRRTPDREASGTHARIEEAETILTNMIVEAEEKYGRQSDLKNQRDFLEKEIGVVKQQVELFLAPEYRKEQLVRATPSLPIHIEQAIEAYNTVTAGNLEKYIVKGPTLKLEGEEVNFSDLNDDYVGLFVFAEFIVERSGNRGRVPSVQYLDLTHENVRKAEMLEFELTMDSLLDPRHFSVRDEASIKNAIIELIRQESISW